MKSIYIPCNVAADNILELLSQEARVGDLYEQMCRLASPLHDDDIARWHLPWVWVKKSDLAPLLFPTAEATEAATGSEAQP